MSSLHVLLFQVVDAQAHAAAMETELADKTRMFVERNTSATALNKVERGGKTRSKLEKRARLQVRSVFLSNLQVCVASVLTAPCLEVVGLCSILVQSLLAFVWKLDSGNMRRHS